MKYSIAKPYITKEEERAVLEVLRSGNLSLGPKYKEFEEKFARKVGTKYACAVSSGTAGLHLSMIAAGVGPGDEVITPSFSFISSANSILYVGAKPIFVEIDSITYNIDPVAIEKAITPKTKAILVVHIFGQPVDMDPIIKIAKKYKLKIIEDACESLCASYKGKSVGTFGESAVFAFYPNKQMTTGEGGMIVTNSKKLYELFCSLRNQGRAENMKWLDHKRLGYNYRMDEMSAALGIAQLSKIDFMINERRKIASLYTKYLKKYSHLFRVPEIAKNNTSSWFVYVISIKNRAKRDRIIDDLESQGIATKSYLPAIHSFDFYKKKFNYSLGNLPLTESIASSTIALPFYIGLKERDVKYIASKVTDTIEKYEK